MKIVLSGASGLFGGIARRVLAERGLAVVSAGRRKQDQVPFDLEDASTPNQAVNGVRAFVHCAAASEVECKEDPRGSIVKNVAGTWQALNYCVAQKIKRFVYISTFHVYGLDEGLVNEETATKPVGIYGLSHLQAEQLVKSFSQSGLLSVNIVRPSNLIDVPSSFETFNRWSLVPYGFCRDAVTTRSITLRTSGVQQRNFVSSRDVAETIARLIESGDTPEVINTPGLSTLSVAELADLVALKSSLRHGAVSVNRPGDVDLAPKTLQFESVYAREFHKPSRTIEDHIDELLGTLSAQ